MAVVRYQVILKTTDNLPANFVTNTLYFDTTVNDANLEDIRDAIRDHYGNILQAFCPTTVAQNGHEMKVYDVLQSAPNYPIRQYTWNSPYPGSGDPLPSEVAMVASFQGPKQSGIPQARRRGRNYIGPLRTSLVSAGRPSSTAITNLAAAFEGFGDDIAALTATDWVVWSGVSQTAVEVTDGWVDNAFDTQRRRGVQTTARTSWVL